MRPLSAIAIIMSLTATAVSAAEAPRGPGTANIASLTTAPPEWTRPLQMIAEDTRLTGESASREFPIYLTAGEAARMAKFHLSYLNAISVMPETFRLTVKINDVVVGETSVQNANQAEALNLSVPVGVLQAGFNSVRISVRQTHRVDCSPNSTYELWTQLMPEQSSLSFSGAAGEIRTLQDLAAVNPGRDGMTAIRVRTPGNREPTQINRAARAVQSAVLLGRFQHPKVTFASDVQSENGLDVIVGSAPALERSMALRVPGAGPRHQLQHNVQTGSVTLIVTGDTDADVDTALEALAHQAQDITPQGSAAGLRALVNVSGRQVEGGETITLSDLGLETEPFRGRLQRQTVRIQMPADLLAADYDRVTVAADAVYASGLLPTSRMIVRVNGAPIAEAPMMNAAGEVLSRRSFFLPVSTFKPGLNTIDFEAETRTAADEKCSLEALADQRERFLLSGTTQITIPSLGRVGALPNISSIIPGGLERLSGSNDLTVFVPKARPAAVETALTTLAKIASVSGQETKAHFAFDLIPAGTPHVLAFGAYDDMPDTTLRAAGLAPEMLAKAWRQPASRGPDVASNSQRVQLASMADGLSLSENEVGAKASVESTGSLSKLTSSMAHPLSGMMRVFEGDGAGWVPAYVRSTFKSLSDLLTGSVDRAKLMPGDERAELPLSSASTLVIAQGARAEGLSEGWQTKFLPRVSSTTVLVAPTPEMLSQGALEVFSGSLWQQFVGDSAVYTPGDNSISTRVSDKILLVPTASLSLHNIRLIAAGWLSHNVNVYLAILLALFVVMTVFMQWTLRTSGVRES